MSVWDQAQRMHRNLQREERVAAALAAQFDGQKNAPFATEWTKRVRQDDENARRATNAEKAGQPPKEPAG